MHRDHDRLLIEDVRHVGGVAAPLGACRIDSGGLREKRLADIHRLAAAEVDVGPGEVVPLLR